jgi:hypothetical protein
MIKRHIDIHPPASPTGQILRVLTFFLFLLFSVFHGHSSSTAAVNEAFRCSWKIVQTRGVYPFCSIELDQTGDGTFRFQKLESELVTLDFHMNRSKVISLYNLFLQASFLNKSKNFTSERKVADLGMKTIRFETGKQQREVTFNYTEDKILKEINDLFENLAEQEKILFEIELALKYDRLGIPKKLDLLEHEFSAGRIVAPEMFKPILKRISADDSLINLARKEARKLLSKIAKMQPEMD